MAALLIAVSAVNVVVLAAAASSTCEPPSPPDTDAIEDDDAPLVVLSRAATATAPLELPDATPVAGATVLSELVGMPAVEFWTDVFEGRSPLHVRGGGAARLAPLLRLAQIDTVLQANVSTRGEDAGEVRPLLNQGDMSVIKLTAKEGEQWTGKWGVEGEAVPLAVLKAGFMRGFSLLLNEARRAPPRPRRAWRPSQQARAEALPPCGRWRSAWRPWRSCARRSSRRAARGATPTRT